MKLSHTLLICACLVFAGINFSTAVTPTPVPIPQQRVQKWEYLVAKLEPGSKLGGGIRTWYNGDGTENFKYAGPDWISRAGNDGWELVTQSFVGDGTVEFPKKRTLFTNWLYLKRGK